MAEAITLGGALKLRYELKYVSASDFDQAIRVFRNREAELENKIPAVVCFAKDDKEASLISKKIKEALQDGSYHIVFIDATATPFGKDGYEQYRNEMANAMYQQGKDGTLFGQYANNAKDALKKWKNRISSGEFIVFTEKKQDGERATTMDMLFSVLQAVNKDKFQRCLEAAYSVLPTMYTPSALKLGVECGATRTTRQTFSSGNVNTKLETALKEAWDDPAYWQTHPNLLISQIKMDVDKLIHTAFDKESGRVSIRAIYDMLKAKPYGFMPCNMTAFIMGFVLKEYTNGSYSWSDGLTNDVMDLNKLKEMVNEIISLQITPNPRYKDKYIVEMTEAEKSFNETTSYAFGIPLNLCTSVEQTRERIRNKMKEFSFPIWTIKSILPSMELKTGRAILEELIDSYCGIANSNNMGKSKTDSDIALAIGDLSAKNPDAKEDLRILLTKDNCTAGMRAYVQEFDGSELVTLAEEIGDNGQYINVLRSKFDADAANWVWNVETAQQKIREVILEYRIIAESNKVIPKNVSFSSTIREWCDKCGLIRISYAAAKNYLGDVAPFLELLHTIKKAGTILDSQKQKFLDLLVAHADEFNAFYSNQVELFKKVCAYYLDGFSEEEVRALYQTIPAGTFTNDKTEYMNLIDSKAKDYRNSLGNERLKKLWKDKTGSTSPRQWSKEHLMPILSLVPDREVQTARAAFGAVNKNHPDASSIEKAVTYLENILSKVYPALYQYLLPYRFGNALLDQYFQDYKYQKVINKILPEFVSQVEDQAEKREYNYILAPRTAVIESLNRKDAQLYFMDAMGVEYLGYILSVCRDLNLIASIKVCVSELPSITSRNKEFLELFADARYQTVPIKDIDDIKHHGKYDFDFYNNSKLPIHLIKELEVIRTVLKKIRNDLAESPLQRVFMIADHGASRLAVLHDTENVWEMAEKGQHSGRCCPKSDVDQKPDFAADAGDFWALANYDRFKGGRKANVEVHGGATLEELCVPIIELTYMSEKPEIALMPIDNEVFAIGDIPEIEVSFRKKAALKIFSTVSLQNVSLVVDGTFYPATDIGNNCYRVDMPELKKQGTYYADVCSGDNVIAEELPFVIKKEGQKERSLL